MKRKGFTLIELLVVISVIALLMAILVPVLQKAKLHARLVICASNQHQIISGIVIYANNNNSLLPPTPSYTGTLPYALNGEAKFHRPTELNWYNNTKTVWDESKVNHTKNYRNAGKYLAKYLPDASIYNCPVITKINEETPWPPESPVGTYGEFYKTGKYTSLHSNFTLLWNYQGYNFRIAEKVDKSTDKNFVAPGKLGDKNQLVILDGCYYKHKAPESGNYVGQIRVKGWYTPHPFKNATRDDMYYVLEQTDESKAGAIGKAEQGQQFRPSANLNAGYLDGHVTRYNMRESLRVRCSNASLFLPEEWK